MRNSARMRNLRHRVRRLLAYAFYYSGLLWLFAEFRLRGKAVVLMYHRVLPPGANTFSHEGIMISPQAFAAHMRFLSRHFRLLTPEQFGAELRGPGFGRRACLVTFDDGWHDNVQYALPILERHAIPAVVFITTDFIGTTKTFWQERLTRRLYHASRSMAYGDDVLRELNAADARSMTDVDARSRMRDVVTSLKAREPLVIERLLSRLETGAVREGSGNMDFGEDRFLSWDAVWKLQQSGFITIGSHSHSHTPLPSLGYAGAKLELGRSEQELQEHGIPASHICAYPNGMVNDSVTAAAKDAGFILGFATGNDRVRNGDDPLRLRRINVQEKSAATPAELLSLMLGVL